MKMNKALVKTSYISMDFSYKYGRYQKHWYHMVTLSPWPFMGSLGALALTMGTVMFLHGYVNGNWMLLIGLVIVLGTMVMWWSDVILEATFFGFHTKPVVSGLRIGMMLFMTSEVMFFFSFFWAFFHASLAPSMVLGSMWPPIDLQVLNPLHIPLLNTLILLTSGLTVTLSHYWVCALKKCKYPFSEKKDLEVSEIIKRLMNGFQLNNPFLYNLGPLYYLFLQTKSENFMICYLHTLHNDNFYQIVELASNYDDPALIFNNHIEKFKVIELEQESWKKYRTAWFGNDNMKFYAQWKIRYGKLVELPMDYKVKEKAEYASGAPSYSYDSLTATVQTMRDEKGWSVRNFPYYEDNFFHNSVINEEFKKPTDWMLEWLIVELYLPSYDSVSVWSLLCTMVLAIEFTLWQFFEYMDALFYISDGVYGSTFYMTTGFHGLHVIMGTIFLIVCLGRFVRKHFRYDHHFGYEAAMWYWHFVDVVWLFLFLWVYIWGYG